MAKLLEYYYRVAYYCLGMSAESPVQMQMHTAKNSLE